MNSFKSGDLVYLNYDHTVMSQAARYEWYTIAAGLNNTFFIIIN